MLYEEILDSLFDREELDCTVPDGTETSVLVIGQLDGETADCYITCGIRDGELIGPLFAVRASASGQQVTRCGEKRRIVALREIEKKEKGPAADQYMQLYPAVRELAFRDSLPRNGKETLRAFTEAARAVIPEGLYRALEEQFPEFADWQQKMLSE